MITIIKSLLGSSFGGPMVWIIGSFAVLISYTGFIERRGYKRCEANVQKAVISEQEKQQKALSTALENAASRAKEADTRKEALEQRVRELINDTKKNTSRPVCIDSNISRRLRSLQSR